MDLGNQTRCLITKPTFPLWPRTASAGYLPILNWSAWGISLVKSSLAIAEIHSDTSVLGFQPRFCLKDLQVIKGSLSTFDFLDREEELTESVCIYNRGRF